MLFMEEKRQNYKYMYLQAKTARKLEKQQEFLNFFFNITLLHSVVFYSAAGQRISNWY